MTLVNELSEASIGMEPKITVPSDIRRQLLLFGGKAAVASSAPHKPGRSNPNTFTSRNMTGKLELDMQEKKFAVVLRNGRYKIFTTECTMSDGDDTISAPPREDKTQPFKIL